MDKIEHISDPKLIQQYVEFHLSIVMNMFHFLISNQQPFRIVIDDPSRKYIDTFSEDIYTDDYVILDISNWTLEVSSIDDKHPYLYTTVVFGETPVDVTIDALDIARIFILTNLTSPLYSRPFVPPSVASSEPLDAAVTVNTIHANAELYASQHSDAIQHSMSCLTLLKLRG